MKSHSNDEESNEEISTTETSESEESTEREQYFAAYRNEKLPSLEETFKGLHFLTFRSDKIKFYFVPSELTKYVDKKIVYYLSIRYRNNKYWLLARHMLPVNRKEIIYGSLFYKYKKLTDYNVVEYILELYKILKEWCEEQQEYRLNKFERYKRGELDWLDLDEDDEDFFLTNVEKAERYQRKIKILKRMIPPLPNQRRPRL